MTVRVLVIDDSPTMRAIIQARLAQDRDIEVVGVAADAAEGREAIKRLDPDVVTLDIEMPGMDGLDFLARIMALRPTPVIIVSDATRAGNPVAARALALGAIDWCAKSELGVDGHLASLVSRAALARLPRPAPGAGNRRPVRVPVAPPKPAVIAVGASTGGVEALQTLFSGFGRDCPPTLVVQHVQPRFAEAIAQTLDRSSPARVRLARANDELERGTIHLAPGGAEHMTVASPSRPRVRLHAGEPVAGHRPSVDVLFRSVAQVFGSRAVGVLLTGMGSDGAQGLLAMAAAGAYTIAQDEATSVVFGMPRAAIAAGAVQVVAPIGKISRLAQGAAS